MLVWHDRKDFGAKGYFETMTDFFKAPQTGSMVHAAAVRAAQVRDSIRGVNSAPTKTASSEPTTAGWGEDKQQAAVIETHMGELDRLSDGVYHNMHRARHKDVKLHRLCGASFVGTHTIMHGIQSLNVPFVVSLDI